MSSGASINLISTAILLSAETHTALSHFGSKNVTINGLSTSVRALGNALGKFDDKVLGLLEGREAEKLNEIVKASIHSLNAVLPILNSAIHKNALAKRQLGLPTRFTSLMAEKRQSIASSVALLNLCIVNIDRLDSQLRIV